MITPLSRNPFLDGQESIGELISLLGHSNLRVRRAAVAALAAREPAETLPGILAALADPDDATARSTAADVLLRYGHAVLPGLIRALDPARHRDLTIQLLVILGKIPSRETVEAVTSLAGHPDPSIAAAAIGCLGGLKDPSTVPTLLDVLDSGQRWQTFYAIDALGEVGHAAAVSRLLPLIGEPYYRKAVLRAMGRIGDESVILPLVAALAAGNPCPDRTALVALNEMVERSRTGASRDAVVEQICLALAEESRDRLCRGLLQLLGDPAGDGERRRYALRTLGWCREAGTIPALVEGLAEPFLNDLAVEALRRLAPSHTESILATVGKVALPDDALRNVVEIIGGQVGQTVDEFLRSCMEHTEADVRQAATAAVARRARRGDLEVLVKVLGDASPLVAQEAIGGLLELAARDPNARDEVAGRVEGLTAARSGEMRCAALTVIARLETVDSAEALDLAMHDPDAAVRRTAIGLLGESADPERLWRLTAALADEDARVREEAVHAVGLLQDGRARGVLLAALQDRSIWVRCRAAQALADHAAVEVQAALEEAARREVPPVRVSAIGALGQLWPGSREVLTELTRDEDPEVRRAALRALAAGGDAVPLDLLALSLEDPDWTVRCASAEGLGASGHTGAFNPLARALDRERDGVVRQALLTALYRRDPESALSLLVSALAEKDVAETAVTLLVEGKSRFADDLRAEWASAQDPGIREGLGVVLREIGRCENSPASDMDQGDPA
jgi:HEAT repeat protein